MSASKKSTEKLRLDVRTKDQTAEIYVIDSAFRVVERGHGTDQTFKLKPGIYTVKVNVGLESREKDLILMEKPETVEFDAIEFASSIPLVETAITHEYHIGAAQEESQNVHIKHGKGCWIYLFTRDWKSDSPTQTQAVTTSFPHRGMKLKGMDGEIIVDLETDARIACNLSLDAWAACNIELDPGQYRLSVEIEAGNCIEQTLVGCVGWQTQVFLLQRNYGPDRTMDARRADLTNTGILMARGTYSGNNPNRLKDKMFDAQNSKMRLVDLARLGLMNNRQVLPDEVVHEILHGKFENPMLGILGAYILLRDKNTKNSLLRAVIRNLRRILGEGTHPDVEALLLRLDHKNARYDFDLPPMLRQSWIQVVKSTATNPELIPGNSFACQNSEQILGDEPWLLYRSQSKETAEAVNDSIRQLIKSQTSAYADSGFEAVPSMTKSIDDRLPLMSGAENFEEEVSDMMPAGEDSMSGGVPEVAMADASSFEAVAKSIPNQLDNKAVNDLVDSMGLPKAKIMQILERLE